MKSIRLSLMVYFLVLLAAALVAVSWLVHQTTGRALEDKETSTRLLLETQYTNRRQAVKEEFDTRILHRAMQLASLAQSQWNPGRGLELQLHPLGLLTAGLNPHGQLLMPLWVTEGTRGPVARQLHHMAFSKIAVAEDIMRGRETEFFQIYSEEGTPLQHSASMADNSFHLDQAVASKMKLLESRFDDPPDTHVRRVTLKAPVSRFRLFRPPPPLLPPRSPDRARRQARKAEVTRGQASSRPVREKKAVADKEEPPFLDRPSPAIFIQCAYDTTERDADLAELHDKFEMELASLKSESADTLARLRDHLTWISVGTFVATLAGGFWLVRLGLSPLHRLSDAVSRVSEKNFRLEFDGPAPPRELRPIVERLTQTLELLKRAFAREKQAAADISHELRTPLAALLTTTEVALRKPRTPEEYRELLEECRGSSQQISQLVERLLALARLDAGADTLRLQELDAVDMAEQCASLVRPLAEARGLSLRVHGQAPVCLRADPDKLREVFTNLLHNAIEYNRPEGSVDLTVERANGSLRVQVRDTGIGIAPELRQQIFERFYRADPSRQADGLHAGLGLAIVKGYVELMGGSIAVDSKEGQGSTFCVQLPAPS